MQPQNLQWSSICLRDSLRFFFLLFSSDRFWTLSPSIFSLTLHLLRSEAVTIAFQLRSKTLTSPFNSRLGCGDSFSAAWVLAQLSQSPTLGSISLLVSYFSWDFGVLGLVAVFDLVFLYGLVFFFLFEMVVVVFCLGALLMIGLGLRRVAFWWNFWCFWVWAYERCVCCLGVV